MQNKSLLSVEEAYQAMFNYLENLYLLTNSDDLGGFLGSMALLPDGKPVDSAVWQDWLKSVETIEMNRDKIN